MRIAALIATIAGPTGRRARTLLGFLVAVCVVAGTGPAAFAAPGGDATIEETTFDVARGSGGSGVATCPAGRRVVGGGVSRIASREIRGAAVIPLVGVQVSGPLNTAGETAGTVDGDVATRWYASVRDERNGATYATYEVVALCSATSDAVIEATAIDVAFGSTGSGLATCTAGRRVVGGGVGTTATDVASFVKVSGPMDETGSTADTVDGDIARSWYAEVYNGNPASSSFKVFALCSASSDAVIEATTIDVAAASGVDNTGSGVATCPASRRVVGGGVRATALDLVGTYTGVSGPLDETGSSAAIDGTIARSWYASVDHVEGSARAYKVFALCATSDVPAGAPAGLVGAAGPAGAATGGATASAGTNGGMGGSGSSVAVPALRALAVTPRGIRAKKSGPSIATRGGSAVSYTLTAPATVRFAILAARSGRRTGTACVKPTRSNRRKSSCTRYVTLPGAFTHQGQAGPNSFRFSGRLAGRELPVGSYRLAATVGDSGSSPPPPALAPLRIVSATT